MHPPTEQDARPTSRWLRFGGARTRFGLLAAGAAAVLGSYLVAASDPTPHGLFGMSELLLSGSKAQIDAAMATQHRATALALLGIVIFLIAIARELGLLLRAAFDPDAGSSVVVLAVSAGFALLGVMVAAYAIGGFSRGRQLRRRGRPLLPKLREGAQWSQRASGVEVPAELRAGVAARWRENGRTEHASVAAFAVLQLELMAVGAPPALIRAASEDALDEIQHAELCFSLARSLDGQAIDPASFMEVRHTARLPRPRTLALAQLAVGSLIEGALLEGASARAIAELARGCVDPAAQVVLRTLAADEGRHARHGWDVVAWCLDQAHTPVSSALRGAMTVLARRPERAASTTPAHEGAWQAYGIAGAQLEARAHARSLAHVARRVKRSLNRRRLSLDAREPPGKSVSSASAQRGC